MILNIPLLADCHTVFAHQEQPENGALLHSNKKRTNHSYKVGQKVLKYDKTLQVKINLKTTGPFDILRVHCNATLTISLCPSIMECVNVCHTLPN
ncbi:hypothetical protein ACHAXS_014345 [Conticribra weissflogii]